MDQADRAHDLAGRAEPALQAIMRDESGLDRMELIAARDAFDGEDIGAVMADRQRHARIDAPAVDQHRTGTALAAVTSLFGAGQMEAFTQEVEKRDAGVIQFDVSPYTVDGEADREVHAGAPIGAGIADAISIDGASNSGACRHIRRAPPFYKGGRKEEKMTWIGNNQLT
jgi:hypothetical protein